ncbi:hypothetical protein HO173_002527 [Letharia columbiana]|uniref:Uncharacterized protein n=1 Tax=Letharia columbiana TaxID=112416 RepID=A0A8H6G2C4_9LECA|nr:uncharacterized protein HO173_002527 [Letharia columbiana]KAF6239266.1 hypothetical protein HO173_002527 [Letharia columbiana]
MKILTPCPSSQLEDPYFRPYLSVIVGAAVAGQVVQFGGGVTGIQKGQRVMGSAIPIAVASGLRVVTTASKKYSAAVTSLGDEYFSDHDSATIVDDVVNASKFSVGIDTISKPPTIKAPADVVQCLGKSKETS